MRRHRSALSVTLCASGLALGVLVAACGQPFAQTSSARTSGSIGAGRSWAFGAPDGITATRTGIWVSDGVTNSVYEFSPSTGGLIRIIAGRRYRFDDPDGIVADRAGIWVASAGDNVVTELSPATGGVIRVASGSRYRFMIPQGIAAAAGRIWVANSDCVTELNAATGALIRVIRGSRYQFSTLFGIAAAGNRVWVPNGNTVTELRASSGSLIRIISGSRYSFDSPDVAAVAGHHVWIGNFSGNSVTELGVSGDMLVHVTRHLPNVPLAIAASASVAWVAMNSGAKGSDTAGPDGSVAELSATTGAIIRVISAARYHVGDPQAVTLAGRHLWIASMNYPGPGGSVTEISAVTGALIRVITAAGQRFTTAAALIAAAGSTRRPRLTS